MKCFSKLAAFCFVFALAATPLVTHAQDKAPAKAEKAAKEPKAIDINSASAADLQNLPGIDATLAEKIIAGRPYANKTQLKKKNVVTAEIYAGIEKQITAKQPKKEKDPAKEPKGKAKGKEKKSAE